jgi:DNA primase catalytic core
MSNLTNWIQSDLYPALYQSIDIALPELNFKSSTKKWKSPLKLDRSEPKEDRPDKTIVSLKAPGSILESGEGAISIIDYVIKRDNSSLIDAIKKLSDIAGLKIPDFDSESYQKYKDSQTILEDANSYFIYCLETSPRAQEVRDYLSSRGYSVEDVKAMELGYIPSQDKLYKYLIETRKHSKELVYEAIKLHKNIGEENRLSIPFRSNGNLTGFIFRTIKPDQSNKYMNSTGLVRSETLFNIKPFKGDKDLVIVEGYLDALISDVRGIDNVVGLGGVNLSSEQVRHAIKKGIKKFTLCLDNDKAGGDFTERDIDIILKEGVNRVYIVILPVIEGKKTDPDQLIKESGVEAFRDAIAQAIPYYEYKLQRTLNRSFLIAKENGGELKPKEIDNLLDEVVGTASKLDPMDRDQYKKLFMSHSIVMSLGITEESFDITVDRLTSTRDRDTQAKELKKLLSEATQLQDKGETDKALELLDKDLKEVKLKDKKGSFIKLLEIPTEEDIKLHFSKASESLKSGYIIDKNELLLPSGGLTAIAGATNHGKTDFLINLTLNAVKNYPNKEFYFFTYEMSQEAILVRFLNSYLDMDLESYSNQRALKTYFKSGSMEYIKTESREPLKIKKEQFFKELIGSGRLRVKGVDYSSPELNLSFTELTKRGNIGGFFVDYFQLLRLPKEGYKNYSRQEELKIICQDLNNTAKDLKLPIILGAQFNREVNTPFKLHATNIGEAGDIERILDTLIGIWNTNKKIVDKDLTKAQETDLRRMGLDRPDKLYTYILKSRETATDVYELLNYNGKRGVIENSNTGGNLNF